MDNRKTSPASKSSNSEDFDDTPIVPPKPIAQKEYKEEVPDISVISLIADNGINLQNFQKNTLRPRDKYVLKENINHIAYQEQLGINSHVPETVSFQKNTLRPQIKYVLNENINHIAYQEQFGINSHVPKTVSDTNKKTIEIVDRSVFKLCAACQSGVLNHAIMTNNGYNEECVPKNRTQIPLTICKEQSDSEKRCKSADEDTISNKTCCKHVAASSSQKFDSCMDTQFCNGQSDSERRCKSADDTILNKTCCKHVVPKVAASSSQKSDSCMHTQFSPASKSKEPEVSPVVNISNCCYSKDQHSRLRKSLPSDGKLLCPACFKKNCKCNFLGQKYNAVSPKNNNNSEKTNEKLSGSVPHSSSDELPSIWDYLKRLDEKIDSIDSKVSNFLLQHATCCSDQQVQKNELSNVTERDIPYLHRILGEHQDKIADIQDQINSFKSSEPKSLAVDNNKIDKSILNLAQTVSCDNTGNCNNDIHCLEKQKVTKTSTHTMTSFSFENDDEVVYCKRLTVLTDTREKEESCLPKEHVTSITKDLNGKSGNSNSQKKKSHKLKCSPVLKCKTNTPSNSSSDSKDKQMIKAPHKSERKSKRISAENKVIEQRYVNAWASDDDVEEQKNSPSLKPDVHKSHSSKQKPKHSISPKFISTETKRDSRNRELSRQISLSSLSSSSSTDTEYIKSKEKQEMFNEMELYSEVDPSFLSLATKSYLNKYGLNPPDKI